MKGIPHFLNMHKSLQNAKIYEQKTADVDNITDIKFCPVIKYYKILLVNLSYIIWCKCNKNTISLSRGIPYYNIYTYKSL